MDVRHNNNALKELNDCIGGLLHLGLNVITFRTLLHLGPNVITFRTLLHLGQLLHLGLQQTGPSPRSPTDCSGDKGFSFSLSHLAGAKFYVCVADNIGRIANSSLRVFGRANRARNGLC